MTKQGLSILSIVALALAGCGGGQTGDNTGNSDNGEQGGPATGNPNCEDTLHPLTSLEEVTATGFSAAQVLEFAAGQFTVPLVWAQPEDVTFGPESGAGELTMTVSYDGAGAHFVESKPKSNEGGGPAIAGPSCKNYLSIDVSVSVQTSGGALNETFETTLKAETLFAAAFNEPLDPMALQGSFEISSVDPPEGQIKQFGMASTFTPFGVTGSVSSMIEVRYPGPDGDLNSGVVGVSGVTYASWPASPACENDDGLGNTGFALAPTASAGYFSGIQAIEQFGMDSPLTVTWQGGDQTELTLAAEPLGDGCLRLGAFYATEPYRVSYPVRISAVSADGHLNGEYTGELTVIPDASGSIEMVQTRATVQIALDQAAQSGFSDVGDVSQFERLILGHESTRSAEGFSGYVRLNGLVDPPCLTEPQMPDPGGMGAPGCMGSEVTEIEGTTWGDAQ